MGAMAEVVDAVSSIAVIFRVWLLNCASSRVVPVSQKGLSGCPSMALDLNYPLLHNDEQPHTSTSEEVCFGACTLRVLLLQNMEQSFGLAPNTHSKKASAGAPYLFPESTLHWPSNESSSCVGGSLSQSSATAAPKTISGSAHSGAGRSRRMIGRPFSRPALEWG